MKFKFQLLLILLSSAVGIHAQEFNKIVTDEETGEPMLIGLTTRKAFNDSSFSTWWFPAYNDYDIDVTTVDSLKDELKDIDITIVMGSWCSDSQYEIPELYKVFDFVDYPAVKIKLICVNRKKQTEGDEVAGLNIELVPTIIFYKDGEELGRIIETPEDTMEKDMLKILVKDDDQE